MKKSTAGSCSPARRLATFPATQAPASVTAPWDPSRNRWGEVGGGGRTIQKARPLLTRDAPHFRL